VKLESDARELVHAVIRGEPSAVRTLVAELLPVVRVRVARTLYRYRKHARRRTLEQEADDLTQEVFAVLFERNAHVLASWDPARGLSLIGFVGLVSDRTAGAILRSGARTPWREDPVEGEALDREDPSPSADVRIASRDLAERLYEALRSELSPLGFRMFSALFVDQTDVDEICRDLGMRPDAVYAWRSRLTKIIREIGLGLESVATAR
jgi:RNA polymerase sigma-70 factor (ECF subfamily)